MPDYLLPAPLFQNQEIGKLVAGAYDLDSLERLRALLAGKQTLYLRRYASGGCSAVTVSHTDSSLESAVTGFLIYQWDRDCIMQCFGEMAVALDAQLGAGLNISPGAWKQGLISCLLHHVLYQHRFSRIITGEVSGLDMRLRPHIRYCPFKLTELPVDWGHAQNDALGMIAYLLFKGLNADHLNLVADRLLPLAEPFTVLLYHYLRTVHVWADFDLGAWEDWPAEHASSIGVVVAALREQRAYMLRNGSMSYDMQGRRLEVTVSAVDELLSLCEGKLREILPSEFVRGMHGSTRVVDAALINPLLLCALSGRPLLDDAMTLRIIANVERELMGARGVCRYPGDVWDGRTNRSDLQVGESAQWCHVSPMISVVFGELYRRSGDESFLRRQTEHFNRGMAHINESWCIPEAYIVDPLSREWVADANQPLAWAQAMVLLSFAAMKQSILHQQRNADAR